MEFKNLSVFMKVGLFSIIFFALGACGSSSSSVPGVQPADTPPQVTRTTPATNATDGVPGVITVVFSENVSGVNDNTFLVSLTDTSTVLTGAVTYDIPSRTATFINNSDELMLFNTNYTVTLQGGDIRDDTGKPLDPRQDATDYIFTFNTGDAPIVDISARLAGDVKQHFISVDNNGRAASVWRQQDSNNVRIYASLFENGKWQSAAMLADITNAANRSDGLLSGLVSNGSGFAAQWMQYDMAGTLNNHVSIYTDDIGGGGNWTGQDTPVNVGTLDVIFPNYLLDTNGNEYVTVWVESNMIRSRFYTSTWSTITDVAPVTASNPSLQLTSDGNGYGLVWLDTDTDPMGNGDDIVNFDFYNGSNWYISSMNKTTPNPARLSLPLTDINGNDGFNFRPRISSDGLYYAVNWYGPDNTGSKSNIFSAVMLGTYNMTGDIDWNGPINLGVKGTPSNNFIVSNGAGYLSTWDAVDVDPMNVDDPFIFSSFFVSSNWNVSATPENDTKLTAFSPLPFSTRGISGGYAMVSGHRLVQAALMMTMSMVGFTLKTISTGEPIPY